MQPAPTGAKPRTDSPYKRGQIGEQVIGCRLTETSTPLRKIFYQAGTNHPLIHILVQVFLDNGLEKARSNLSETVVDSALRRDWKCPNVYAKHDEFFRIPVVLIRQARRGLQYFHARYSCGFVFAFAEAKENDPNMPIVLRTSGYGKAIEVEAKRLFKKHGSFLKVSEGMNLDRRIVKRLVQGYKSAFEATPEKIARLRRDWLKTQSRRAYQTLLKYDREWMLGRRNQQGRRREYYAPHPIREKDDIALSAQIEAAAWQLRAEGKKVTILGLERRLGRSINLRGLNRLPRTTATLRNLLDIRNSVLEAQFEKNFSPPSQAHN